MLRSFVCFPTLAKAISIPPRLPWREAKRRPNSICAPWLCASSARARIKLERSITKSGDSRGMVAARPSVNSSKRLILLTTDFSEAVPRRWWMRSVTIRVRRGESSRSARSKKRTLQPRRARSRPVNRPAAEAPTIPTEWPGAPCCSMSPKSCRLPFLRYSGRMMTS